MFDMSCERSDLKIYMASSLLAPSIQRTVPGYNTTVSLMKRMLSSHTTNRVLLVRPQHFGSNVETKETCGFQDSSPEQEHVGSDVGIIKQSAAKEFEKLLQLLKSCGIEVTEEQDQKDLELPDSVFPNNWISFHDNKPTTIVTYPMLSKLRRLERQDSIILKWQSLLSADVLDLSHHEREGVFLEGTGSMVLDRTNRFAYACISPRTNVPLLNEWCDKLNYRPIVFNATHKSANGDMMDIYHTNVMMSIAEKFVIVCLESIHDKSQRKMVEENFKNTGKTIIPITAHQMANFAGNALQLFGSDNQRFYFMSTRAYETLEEWQKEEISKSSSICHTAIDTIENHGGGGVRCMIAEIFPPLS